MKRLISFLCISLAFTNLSFFKIGSAEFTLFHAAAIAGLLIVAVLLIEQKSLHLRMPRYWVPALIYLFAVNLYYFELIKKSSFTFSLIILLELLFLYNCSRLFRVSDIKKILKIIIAFYFVNIAVASAFIFLKYYPSGWLGSVFRIYIFDGRIRPYGFSDEPSYAAIILVFTLYVFFKSDNFRYNKSEFNWYVMAILTILMTGSSYGYMFLAILLLYFLFRSRVLLIKLQEILKSRLFSTGQLFAVILFMLGLLIAGLLLSDLGNNKSIYRLMALYDLLVSSEGFMEAFREVAEVDGSASMRIVPTIQLIDHFKETDLPEILFGKGAGQATPFFSEFYDGNTTVLGFIPSFIYNYGVLGALLFFRLFWGLFPHKRPVFLVLFLLFLFNADFNTQIFLFVLFCAILARQIEKEQTDSNQKHLEDRTD